eukprot:6252798-Amphidinium_carterae.1
MSVLIDVHHRILRFTADWLLASSTVSMCMALMNKMPVSNRASSTRRIPNHISRAMIQQGLDSLLKPSATIFKRLRHCDTGGVMAGVSRVCFHVWSTSWQDLFQEDCNSLRLQSSQHPRHNYS